MKRADLLAALIVGLLGLTELAATSGQRAASALSVAVVAVPLAARSRRPLGSAAAMSTWWLVDRAVGGTFDQPFTLLLGPMLAAYSLLALAPPRRAALGLALLLCSLEAPEALAGGPDYGFLALLLGLPALTGWGVRRHRERGRALAALTERLEAERGASERLAVAEERRRIAGELHDAIAHAVSRMVVQAGGAEQILSDAPERARAAFGAIQATGREAIGELRQSLRTLRAGESAAAAPEDGRGADWPRAFPWPRWADVPLGPAVVLAADAGVIGHASPGALAAMAVAAVAVALRRRVPFTALGIALGDQLAAIALPGALAVTAPFAAILVSLYTLAAHAPLRRAAAAAGVAALTLAPMVLATGPAIDLVALTIMLGAAGAAGLPGRAARRQTAQLERLASRLERERDARARLATLEERARIARELHDSVAHAVSVMVLQAGAAEAVLDDDRERALEATRAIERHGRAALEELRALLGVLGDAASPGPRAPQPSLRELDDLITDAGLPVRLTVTGDPVPLPAGIDVTAYRVIQEALTNALKHAGRVPTTVALDYAPRRLTLDVSDAGGRAAAPAAGAGHGLIGMRERVALYGGDLTAGPLAGAGYAIHAELPLP